MRLGSYKGELVFFTADEHYGHHNIIKYSDRPFRSVEEMNEKMISNFNQVVSDKCVSFHLGDFSLNNKRDEVYTNFINRLNGKHVFLLGSHDRWMDRSQHEILDIVVDGQKVVLCHYAMRVWAASHYNSWLLYGHSHGGLNPEGKSWDVGVDTNSYKPYSWESIKAIMADRPDNFNLIKNRRY